MKKIVIVIIALLFPTASVACWPHYVKMMISDHSASFKLSESDVWTDRGMFRNDPEKVLPKKNGMPVLDKENLMYAVMYKDHVRKGAALSTIIKYTGELRPASKVTRDALFAFGGDNIRDFYPNELHVVDEDFDVWVPVQKGLYEPLLKEMEKGRRFRACLTLIGRIEKTHFYIMNEFSSNP
ncbi:MAG: hypothetical protein HZB82_06155 [Deltaproteobacteria bacterium]|nr:hypothetical protein [Deltaproteobacteria bacterium]